MNTALQIIVGFFLADFLSAFFHFFEDTYLPNTNSPGILGEIARDNELHHALPFAMASIPSLDNIRVTLPLSLAIALSILVIAPSWTRSHIYLILTMIVVGTLSNLIHRWQHERDCTRPKIVTLLQRAGILVSREQHKIHHEMPDRMYGVVSPVGNWFYDTFGIWDLFRLVIPLQKHDKPSVSEYTQFIPETVKRELDEPCPRRLSPDEIQQVRQNLTSTAVQ
jgi:hypothetical protein